MRARLVFGITLVLMSVVLFPAASAAQTGSGKGRINGTVTDEAGQPLAGAKITVVFVQTRETIRETTTDKKGQWAAIGLGTGLWKVTAEFPGYIPSWTEVTIKQLGKNPAIPLALKKEQALSEPRIAKDTASLDLVEKADLLCKEKKFDEAIAVYEEIKAKNPEIYLVDLSIGDCRLGKGETDKALEIYGQVLEKARADLKEGRNNEARTLARIGEGYVQKGDILKAQDYFRQSLELLPDDELLAYNVGEIFFSNRKLDEAIQYFGIAAKIKPDWSEAHYKLGLACLNKTDYENARRAFARFLELEPDTQRAASVKNILETIDKINPHRGNPPN